MAQQTKIPARMLRYYEEQGLLTPERLDNGYRDYDQSLVGRAEKIRCFVDAGVPLRAIDSILSSVGDARGSLHPEMTEEFVEMLVRERDRMRERVATLERNIASLTELIESTGWD
ncbi:MULTISPECIES: MerR family transcriptional regulator [unclassified Curtobacterium]|uniref:MerR family transcriptional regulator n=1 Tax=unclassified Curtobacterium TaxID=257496 RepID=UPI0021AC13F0|nr:MULTISPECIES: MerR family transcriptional regulator [unclassified Curtobacterium]WIB15529.1 MerR family transcriptional regulator [Curtobacterium sp. MCPF17_050]